MTDSTPATLFQKYTRTKLFFLAGYASLQVLFVYWNFTRPSGSNITVLLIQALPLLVFLPGLLKNHYRTYSWVCFIILFYFVQAVAGAFTSTANITDLIFVALTVYLFVTAMMASRWAQRLQHESQRSTSANDAEASEEQSP